MDIMSLYPAWMTDETLLQKKKKKTKKRKRNQSVELVGTVDHKKIRKVTGEGLGPHPDTLLPGLSHPL